MLIKQALTDWNVFVDPRADDARWPPTVDGSAACCVLPIANRDWTLQWCVAGRPLRAASPYLTGYTYSLCVFFQSAN